MPDYSLPPIALLDQQAAWLASARSRMLRRVEIARRRRVLDLACGPGAVTEELARRSGGKVVAIDVSRAALTDRPQCFSGSQPLRANAENLPLADGSMDLVFCQFALMWMDATAAVKEIRRVLAPGGALAAIEPDYGGMIEHPPEIALRDLWIAALERAGADPRMGRKLPSLLAKAGLKVRVDLPDRLEPPLHGRFELLRGLPLTDEERASLEKAEQADTALGEAPRTAHLPLFFITAATRNGNP
jgi:SAM-dependent methyltransferase